MWSQTWSLTRQFRLLFIFPGTLTTKMTNFRRIDFCYFLHIWCMQKVLWTAAKFRSSDVRVPRYGESNMVPHATISTILIFPGTLTSKTTDFRRIDFFLFFTHLMCAKSSVDSCKILKFWLQGSETIAAKKWVPCPDFDFSRYFELENDQLPTNRFLLFFTHLMYAKSSVDCCKI